MITKFIQRFFLSRYLGSLVQTVLSIAGTWLITQGAGTPEDIQAVQEGLNTWLSSPEFSTWLGSFLLGGGLLASWAQDLNETKDVKK